MRTAPRAHRSGRLLPRLRGAHERCQARARIARARQRPARRARARRRRGRRHRRRRSRTRLRAARARRSRARARRHARDRQPGRTRHPPARRAAMRVVLADDAAVLREGHGRMLAGAGIEVAAQVATAAELLAVVDEVRPDVAVVDIRMPPTWTDEGLVAAGQIGERHPEIGVLLLSQYVEAIYALRLLEAGPTRTGYLLKDRVLDLDDFITALERVTDRGISERLYVTPKRPKPTSATSSSSSASPPPQPTTGASTPSSPTCAHNAQPACSDRNRDESRPAPQDPGSPVRILADELALADSLN